MFSVFDRVAECPECKSKVRLEDVRFTPRFQCPVCQEDISVSAKYMRGMRIFCMATAWGLPVFFGVHNILILFLASFPLYGLVIFAVAYAGKYLVPPRLQSTRPRPPGVLGLE